MFVQINRWSKGTMKDRTITAETLYECAQIHVSDEAARPGTPHCAMVVLDGVPRAAEGTLMFVVDKETSDIFVMNDNGRTISAWRWSERFARQREQEAA